MKREVKKTESGTEEEIGGVQTVSNTLERRSKRLRASPPPIPDDAGRRYLDTLPDDSLRIVLRHLSRRPNNHNWHSYLSPLAVCTALDVGGGLARAARFEFHRLGGKDSIEIDMILDASILRPLVHRLPLHRLVLNLGRHQLLPDLLRGCGGQLKELILEASSSVVTEMEVNAVSTHCTQLSSFVLRTNHVEGTLIPIWRSLGSTLEHIYLDVYYSPLGRGALQIISVSNLVQHCVKLKRVDVNTLRHGIADVLIALGKRVRVLKVEREVRNNPILWRKVFRSCTNIDVVLADIMGSNGAIDILSIIRAKVRTLILRTPMPATPRFSAAVAACSSLEEIELISKKCTEDGIPRALFESIASVRKLSCDIGLSKMDPKKDIIDLVASTSRNLESFSISTYQTLQGEDVRALVDLPLLKHVTLRCRFFKKQSAKSAEMCAIEVVNKFKLCPQLMSLEIDDMNIKNRSSLVANAAYLYGQRNFDMFVGGVQYATRLTGRS